jgi:hypothetical protein
MAYKFEDLVDAINSARSEFDLSRLQFDMMKEGLTDLQNRLQALETHPAVSVPPLTQDAP